MTDVLQNVSECFLHAVAAVLPACVLLQSRISVSSHFHVTGVQADLSVFHCVGSGPPKLAVADWPLCAGLVGGLFLSRCFLILAGFVWLFSICFRRDGLARDTEEPLCLARETRLLEASRVINSPHWLVKRGTTPPAPCVRSLSFACQKQEMHESCM